MKVYTMAMTGLVCVGISALALANPALLPKHPGYPSGGEFAYDTGQAPLTHNQSLLDAAESENANIVQALEDPNDPQQLRQERAGLLPIAQGYSADATEALQSQRAKRDPSVNGTTQKPKQ